MASGLPRQGKSSLQQFQLQGVRYTGRTIGNGSYATVVELNFRGLKCVGKKIHELLYNSASPLEQANLLERFADECELLSRLHHPCIVQFMGVHFEQDSQLPVLVMEYLHTTLSACIDRYGILPREITYEILRDVILGLRYLHEHSPSIIHRDLSANNVLLTPNMSAKISDLGVAKILNLSPAQMGLMTQTQAPGTPCYMPPEAMTARPKYTNKVDIFSFGVMMVHVLSGQWPIPSEVFQPDPANPDLTVPVSEVDRRAEYLLKIDQDHPLMGLTRQCLSNNPKSRPEAIDILGQVESVISRLPPSLENRVELIQRIQGQPRVIASNGSEPSSPKGAKSIERMRVVVLIGGVGFGKKTIGNHIAGNTIFRCESTAISTMREPGYSYGECIREGILYRILTIDTETLQSIDISKILESQNIETVNLIMFVIKHGRYSNVSHASMVSVVPHLATRISALVFTGCECLTKERRSDLISTFRIMESKVSAFMGKGIHTVGFPSLAGTFLNSTLQEAMEEVMKEVMKEDDKTLHNLVEGIEYAIPTTSFPRLTARSTSSEVAKRDCSIM